MGSKIFEFTEPVKEIETDILVAGAGPGGTCAAIAAARSGAKVLLVGNVIKSEFLISRNWPFGSAISIGLTILMALLIFIYYRANKLLNKKVELE